MTTTTFLRTAAIAALFVLPSVTALKAQNGNEPVAAPAPEIKQPVIADEPKTIDPATLVPEVLARKVTVDFAESSLREIGQWIEEEQKIPVLFDSAALSEEGIPLGEPVTDKLSDAPLYLLLNRLRSLGLSWYVEHDILHITTEIAAEERLTTEPYNVADLLDAGYKLDDLSATITSSTSGPWSEVDGTGGDMQWLGDVQFIRQTDRVHREVAGLLAALRKHARQTYTFEPPQNLSLRAKLQQNVDVQFRDVPLIRAVEELAKKSGADIRIERASLRKEGVRDRELVSLVLTDRSLGTILDVLLNDLGLTYILRDGVLWITTEISAAEHLKTAVYDVRDLCRDEKESTALAGAVLNQTAGPWTSVDGTGGSIEFAKSGTMVVRQTERGLQEVLNLLETYRKALRASKPRDRDAVDPNEVVTHYYRTHADIAGDLLGLLPQLVEPETWQSGDRPDAPGTMLKASSRPELLDAGGKSAITPGSGAARTLKNPLVAPQAVLIIRQTRKTHEEIARVIRQVEQGDPPSLLGQGLGGLGGVGGGSGLGGGGFGSGFFSVPQPRQRGSAGMR